MSEKGFSAQSGIAVLPTDPEREDLFTRPGEEMKVDQSLRQEKFESYSTTDDHLMHIVGTAIDKAGNKYYKVKNSWGSVGSFGGFIYMSIPYFRAKTIAVMVHTDALPETIGKKLLQG